MMNWVALELKANQVLSCWIRFHPFEVFHMAAPDFISLMQIYNKPNWTHSLHSICRAMSPTICYCKHGVKCSPLWYFKNASFRLIKVAILEYRLVLNRRVRKGMYHRPNIALFRICRVCQGLWPTYLGICYIISPNSGCLGHLGEIIQQACCARFGGQEQYYTNETASSQCSLQNWFNSTTKK